MKRFCALFVILALPFAAYCAEQDQLLTVLQSNQPFKAKDAACSRLKLIGTAQSVPVLAALLTNDELSHSARYALESMPCPEAGRALLAALNTTSGSNQVGIINSLAARHDTAAIPRMGKLLQASDPMVASAAAEALGRLGGAKSVKLLQAALQAANEPVREAETDGLLACANKFLTDGKDSPALKIFRSVYDNARSDDTRLSAWRGVLLASGAKGVDMMAESISGSDLPRQGAALQVAGQLKGPAVTKALIAVLPKVPVPVQIALLQCLDLRRDPSAMAAVAPLVDSADADVRLAAITALGDVGDGSVVLLLARHAAEGTGAERNAARQSLDYLRHGQVTPTLLAPLTGASPAVSPEVSAELLRALGDRGDSAAAPVLLELARRSDDSIRGPALQALAMLAGSAQIPELVQLVMQATNDDVRSEAADALSSIYQRGHPDGQPVLEAVAHGPVEVRVALLPVCSSMTGAPAREALRAALADPDPRVQEAAVRALCETRDGQLLPDMVQVACNNPNKTLRVLGVRGCVALTTQDESVKLSDDEKLDALTKILATPLDEPEKRLVLSGLGTIASAQALALATPMLDDPAVRAEAVQAVIHISSAISAAHPAEAGAALKKVLAMSINSATRKSAEKAFKNIRED